jgi:branched-chain amino acid transport system permease protein
VLVASFDLLLGYTGIVSFAHTMFFGIGAYGIAIASTRMGTRLDLGRDRYRRRARLVGAARVRDRPLQPAGEGDLLRDDHARRRFGVPHPRLALSDFTGGEDGLTFKVPAALQPGTQYLETPWLGASIDGRFASYYLLFLSALALVLLMLRIVNSPFGRVLQAIRENDFRAEAIGYRTVVYRTLSNVLSAVFATLAGALLALWLRYNGPATTLSFEIMLDLLLIVVIGGMGTIYGAVIGSVLLVLAQSYLQDLMKLGATAVQGVRCCRNCCRRIAGCCGWGYCSCCRFIIFRLRVVGRLRAMGKRRGTGGNEETHSDTSAPRP